MASKETNAAVARLREQDDAEQRELRQRQAARKRALAAVEARQAAVTAAERERDTVTARLNAAVVDAHAGFDLAVAVLARLSPSVERAAELVGPSVAEVRRAVQRAPKADVDAQAAQLLTGSEGRRSRAPRAVASRGAGDARTVLTRTEPESDRDRDQRGDAQHGGDATE
ncbi:hypothetical protein GCM10010172_31560 [Paractinoplanes ferrugineus]|uniref:Uncharacterized protein n=1 Tax=Paractinoplanes ferrugineus TaxID=113564 RepID=A0A919J6C8_9ACTN|nr:hypothetical protein [Actinoplanes ferrugineus]GIE14152.1 hypothetical protein Afe05nite_59920 [Actinoplanes ferrugineus]